ncbi:MAG: polyprenyl synthetase family protein [Candidatus Aenigmarchaeota archaeon]|nr:polyprenyl synthetase family protein [Candidatus Aenigmarchaeota archaeon]
MKNPTLVLKAFERYEKDLRKDLEIVLLKKECQYTCNIIKYFLGWLDERFSPIEVYGGKRFRGGLCLLVSEIISGDYRRALPVASSLELFHNFTLIHDDVEDNDPLRRGRPTVWKVWGKNLAINTGDVGLILSLLSLNRLNKLGLKKGKILEIQEFLGNIYLKIGQGQFLDLTMSEKSLTKDISEKEYLKMIEYKTSVLVGASTKSGAMIATDNKWVIENFYHFGLNLGLAYQVFDDTISIWGNPEFSGKLKFNDIKEKKKTLPIVYAFNHTNSKIKKELADLYSIEKINDNIAKQIVEILDKTNSYAYCWNLINRYKENSLKFLRKTKIKDINQIESLVHNLIPNVKNYTKIAVK